MSSNNDRFFIPDKIKVGFQGRKSTYTGKLAYIIYYDNKGVLRKEKSWEGWRDKSISPEDFENKPTSGFMLNRHAGGYSSGWNHRQSYCRIWDPRGFEFEITIDNLLWILDHVDCNKGKTLDGEFVYSWVGTDLVLLPCVTEEYRVSSSIVRKTENYKKSDLVPGTVYRFKTWFGGEGGELDGHCAIYLGELKLANGFGKRFKTSTIFLRRGDNGKDTIIVNPFISGIDYIKEEGFLDQQEIPEYLEKVRETPFSWDFWNNPNSLPTITRVFSLGKKKREWVDHYKPAITFDHGSGIITYFRNIYEYRCTDSRYCGLSSWYDLDRFLAKSYEISFNSGKIELKEIVEFGVPKFGYNPDTHFYGDDEKAKSSSRKSIYPKVTDWSVVKDIKKVTYNDEKDLSTDEVLVEYEGGRKVSLTDFFRYSPSIDGMEEPKSFTIAY